MSDLTATNCGCGCEGNNGISICTLLILLAFCGNGNGGCGFGGNGGNDCCWIILLLLFCGGCGNGSFLGNGGNCVGPAFSCYRKLRFLPFPPIFGLIP